MASNKSRIDSILSRAWAVGLITFLAGLLGVVVMMFVNEPLQKGAALSLLAALVGANLARLITDARERISDEISEGRKLTRVLVAVDELSRALARVENPFLSAIGHRLVAGAEEAAGELSQPAEVFKHQGEYMRWAVPVLRTLAPEDQVLAVCGDKDWDDDAVMDFNRENCEAAKRGARVERIFLQLDKRFPPGEEEVIRQHLKAAAEGGKIVAWHVKTRDARRVIKDYGLPKGFGLTYICRHRPDGPAREDVLVHWGLKDSNREGLRLESPQLVQLFLGIFWAIRYRAGQMDATKLSGSDATA